MSETAEAKQRGGGCSSELRQSVYLAHAGTCWLYLGHAGTCLVAWLCLA